MAILANSRQVVIVCPTVTDYRLARQVRVRLGKQVGITPSAVMAIISGAIFLKKMGDWALKRMSLGDTIAAIHTALKAQGAEVLREDIEASMLKKEEWFPIPSGFPVDISIIPFKIKFIPPVVEFFKILKVPSAPSGYKFVTRDFKFDISMCKTRLGIPPWECNVKGIFHYFNADKLKARLEAKVATNKSDCEAKGGAWLSATGECTLPAAAIAAVPGVIPIKKKFPKWAWFAIGGGAAAILIIIIATRKKAPLPVY